MEIVNIESHTWEMMMARFETFAERVEQLCRCNGDKARSGTRCTTVRRM